MQYLIDTGVLLRLFDDSDPHFATIRDALRKLRRGGHSLYTCHQNIAEFWNVSTRPMTARGGYGHSQSSTERRVRFIESFGHVIGESPASYYEWRRLVLTHAIVGVAVHDARIVAIMFAASITHIITLNPDDFRRYAGLVVLTPADIR